MRSAVLATVVLLAAFAASRPAPAGAAPCASPDNRTRVTGSRECLVIKTFGNAGATGPVLFVVVHGDTSGGGPSDYHYAVAEKLATEPNTIAVALIRPGYFDSGNATSSGSNNNRTDSYTAANIDEVAGAVVNLKTSYKPSRIVLVGHSGGSAISAVILGRAPHLADGAVLVSCPCDVTAWRRMVNRRPWPNSESPIRYVDRIPNDARVAVLVGANDTDTPPKLSEDYANALKARGILVTYDIVPGAGHNSAFRDRAVIDAARTLAR